MIDAYGSRMAPTRLAGLPNDNAKFEFDPIDVFNALPEGYFAQIPNWADWVPGAVWIWMTNAKYFVS